MADTIDLEFPDGMPKEVAASLAEELKRIQGVKSAGVSTARGLDPASLMAWVKLASAAAPVVTALIAWIRGKGLKKVKLKLGDITIEADSASAAEIQRLVKALSAKK